jgi:hypothetical protein
MRGLHILGCLAALIALASCGAPPPFVDYSYPAWGFAVSFRGRPNVTEYPASADGKSRHALLVESVLAGRDDLVSVVDGTGSPKSDDEVLASAPSALAAYVGGTAGPIAYAASGNVIGREFLLSRPGKPTSRVRIFVANQHLYQLISQSALGPDDPEVASFLAGFRLLKTP